MEYISYREAEFNVIQTVSWERTRIRDEANNYLYTHHDFTVDVNYHPVLAAYTRPGKFNAAPVATPGASPGATDLALLTRLLQPRGLLRVTAGGTVVLETPAFIAGDAGKRYDCDVRGGPSVEMVGVPLQVGYKHWVVRLHFIADVRDYPEKYDDKNAVISNLWTSEETIDYQRRSVRRFAGRAILRADIMRNGRVNANSFRDLFLFACPNHYQRQVVHVQMSEDGTELHWMFEDTMRGYDLGLGSPIVDIECYRTGTVARGSPAKLIVDLARNATRAGSLPGVATSVLFTLLDNLPRSYRHVRCDLTGDRNGNLGVLSSIALGVCTTHLGLGGLVSWASGTLEVTFRQDIADTVYTSCEMSTQFTDDAIINAVVAAVDRLQNWQDLVPTLANASNAATRQMVAAFMQDSRNVRMMQPARDQNQPPAVIGPAPSGIIESIIASRQGDNLGENFPPAIPAFGRNNNPPMRQGAFGVVPQTDVGIVPGAGPLAVSIVPATPTGSIPAGIEHLIVQALLGQDMSPPQPTTLETDS